MSTTPLGLAGPPKHPEPELDRRRQILDGAAHVFLELGYEGASMSVIAQQAGVSKGTLYVYFTNKEALFSAVLEDYRRRHAEHVFESLNSDGSLEAALLDCGRRYLATLTRPSVLAIYRLAIAEAAKFPQLGRMFFETGPRQSIHRMAEFLHARDAAGEIAIGDYELAAAQFLEVCRAAYFLPALLGAAEEPGPAQIERQVNEAVRVFLAAYRPPA